MTVNLGSHHTLLIDVPETYASPLSSAHPIVDIHVNGSLVLWYLVYPDQARVETEKGIRVAESLNHPFSLAFALALTAGLHQRAEMAQAAAGYAHLGMEVSAQHGFAFWFAVCQLYHGWTRVAQGDIASGSEEVKSGLAAINASGIENIRYAAALADVHLRCGEIDAGLAEVEALLAMVERTEEREWEAELHRLKGELLAAQDADPAIVEACFERATAVAVEQKAKSLELRATLSLARLLYAQDRVDEAAARLGATYGWFSVQYKEPPLGIKLQRRRDAESVGDGGELP